MVCAAGICCYAVIKKKILNLFVIYIFSFLSILLTNVFPSSGIDQVDEMVDDASILFAYLLSNKGNAEGQTLRKLCLMYVLFYVCAGTEFVDLRNVYMYEKS